MKRKKGEIVKDKHYEMPQKPDLSSAESQVTDAPWELFIDRQILNDVHQRMYNVRQTLHQPVKYEGNPIFSPEMPWEGGRCQVGTYPHDFGTFGGTLYDPDEKIFKMWYVGVGGGIPNNWFMCYATSKDGIHWERPNLGMFPYNGSK